MFKTHVSTFIFQGLFKKIVFRSVAFVIKKLWAILDFYTDRDFYRPVFYPINKKNKKITKNPFYLNFYLLKIKKFYGDSVKNKSARTKKLEGGAKRPPPPACLGLSNCV